MCSFGLTAGTCLEDTCIAAVLRDCVLGEGRNLDIWCYGCSETGSSDASPLRTSWWRTHAVARGPNAQLFDPVAEHHGQRFATASVHSHSISPLGGTCMVRLMVFRPLPLTHPMFRSVSAWQERQPTVTSNTQPPLLYDFYGFPEESYKIQYDAPGAPQLAQRIAGLLKSAGLSCDFDSKRGWDHGVFVPLKLLYPAADIPIVEMSMLKSLSAEVNA